MQGAQFEEIRAQNIYIATYPHRLADFMQGSGKNKTLQKWMQSTPIAYNRYVMPIHLLSEGVPVGLAPRSLLVADKNKPLENDNLLLIDRGSNDKGKTTLWVRFICPYKNTRHIGELTTDGLLHDIMKRLAAVIPFLNENQIPPYMPVQEHGFVYNMPEQAHMQVTGLPTQTPYKNMFVSGVANLPGMGVEGELLSGLKVAQSTSSFHAGVHASLS